MSETETTDQAATRPRNAAATREAILAAARAAFARDGYDRVGVRDIAAAAGVNAALVIRYFGSKEGAFREALAEGFDLEELLGAADRARVGELLARYVLQKEDAAGGEGLTPMLILLRSTASEHGAALLRQVIDERFVAPMARWMGGDGAEVRAALLASCLVGLILSRSVLRSAALAAADTEDLVASFAPVLQGYIDGP